MEYVRVPGSSRALTRRRRRRCLCWTLVLSAVVVAVLVAVLVPVLVIELSHSGSSVVHYTRVVALPGGPVRSVCVFLSLRAQKTPPPHPHASHSTPARILVHLRLVSRPRQHVSLTTAARIPEECSPRRAAASWGSRTGPPPRGRIGGLLPDRRSPAHSCGPQTSTGLCARSCNRWATT